LPQVLNYELRDNVARGDVAWAMGEVEHFTAFGVQTTAGAAVNADVVIYATGFGKDYSLFDAPTQALLAPETDGLYLFRNTV
jgi:cation diffusion facilitator CzcD-associated flavoprotein CzcO